MKPPLFYLLALGLTLAVRCVGGEPDSPALLPRVRVVWDLDHAERQSTATRERVCLNGLWRWQPAKISPAPPRSLPERDWGHFKVPGPWPGISDYMQKDCQTVLRHPSWKDVKLADVTAAWHQRDFTVPAAWEGRRVALSMEYLNSLAIVWVDGEKAGETSFPGGEIDLTAYCRAGRTHQLSVLVIALPLKEVMVSHADTFGGGEVKGKVERRGLCGDVWLWGTPAGPRLEDPRVRTSVREGQIEFDAAAIGLEANGSYSLRAMLKDHGQPVAEFASAPFESNSLSRGRATFKAHWKPKKLWDLHTPDHLYELSLSLLDRSGKVLDVTLPERFGFRELWIDGRDFYLNGSRIFLCAVPLDNAQVGAAWATYDATRESLRRLKSFGVNFVYTHNYGCEPGTHLGFAEILRACDDEGMLVSFSQPHFAQYAWDSPEAARTNGYAAHAAFYARAAGNHPSVVFYSMSHNATGTEESMNPDMIDGRQDARNRWSANNAKKALQAEAIVRGLDPSRIVYHHSSGNLGSMHTANFYANFAPIQEMSDWFEHWATSGIKPVFLCEYGVPISWDWMMYRGWFKGVREFGSAQVPWELCLAEWNAQFLGDRAYQISELEGACLRWEAAQFKSSRLWHRWDYPRNAVGSPEFEQRNEILAMYLTDNIRAFRTWGLSAFCPWDHGDFWKLREGAGRRARSNAPDLATDWERLQRPGFSPDFIEDEMEWMNLSHDRGDWLPTAAADALYRNNMPLLAYLGGKPAAFTSKDHNFSPGETVQKQLILINNSRETVHVRCEWSINLPKPITGRAELDVPTGQPAFLPVECDLPQNTLAGRYSITAKVQFEPGDTQEDSFFVDVLPRPATLALKTGVALFDPRGETRKWLRGIGVDCRQVDADSNLDGVDLLIVGKAALTLEDRAPDISRVRDGLNVIVFEQSAKVLEKRFGFRTAEYGLRWVFKRVPDHPLLAGLAAEHFWNWRGEATLTPPRLEYRMGDRHAPEVEWCGMPVTRLWRAGNRGNVASVLIEKPACGDFMPILDGGFSSQYSPLMEAREGQGKVLFCQMDVTGRTENDPAAEILVRNLWRYAALHEPAPRRKVWYAGEPAGRSHLQRAGFAPEDYTGGGLTERDVLVAGPGAESLLANERQPLAAFLAGGGKLLAVGLDQDQANAFLPFTVGLRPAEHIASFFEAGGIASPLAGVGPADVHNRDPRVIPLVKTGARGVGDGALALADDGNIVFCQLAPWQFDSSGTSNVRRTFRRSSFLLTRLMGNADAAGSTPLLDRFSVPVEPGERRWEKGFYLDIPVEWDDPYRFFCW